MPKTLSSQAQTLLAAMADSSAALAAGACAEIEAAHAFVQAQMAAVPALLSAPPTSPAAALAQIGGFWATTIEAGIASVARTAEIAAKAGAPLVNALRPTA